jgi:hypothetical protein
VSRNIEKWCSLDECVAIIQMYLLGNTRVDLMFIIWNTTELKYLIAITVEVFTGVYEL